MSSLHYHEFMGKIEEDEKNIVMMVDSYMLGKLLDTITEIIGIRKIDDTKILVDTNGKLPDNIALKNVMILRAYVIKDDRKFYP